MNAHPLSIIEGEQLSSVEFVQDYVQLRFDGPYLTAITLHNVELGNIHLKWGMPGYRDALCDRIGTTVQSVSVITSETLLIKFADGAIVSISLRPEDYRAEEAVMFDDKTKQWDVILHRSYRKLIH
jgi:hypothetical protein